MATAPQQPATQKRGTTLLYALLAQARTYPDIILLGRGDPDLDTPTHIISAAEAALHDHSTEPSPPEGLLALRQAIAARVKKYNHIDVDPETEVVVTQGGQEALFLMVLATIGPGDELLMPEPNYNTYLDSVRFAGGTQINVPSSADRDFRVDVEGVRAAITSKTKAMLLVSPNNPSATVIPPEDVRALVSLAEEKDLLILADDIYDRFLYDDYVHLSPASLPGAKARTLTLNAMSKAFAMTGWRVGWIVGPADLMAYVKQLKAAISGSNAIATQYAALTALTGQQDVVEEMRQIYASRRRLVMDALDAMDIPYGMPQGGQFLFADISFTGMSSLDLAQRILEEQHVLAYPGTAFGAAWEHCLRITFLAPEEKLREGLEKMKETMYKIKTG
jgi:aminotransferase